MKLGDEGARVIATHLPKTHLEQLVMNDVEISEAGVKVLAPAVAASMLKVLDISENCIGDSGISALCAELCTNKTLIELNASGLSFFFFFGGFSQISKIIHTFSC